MTFNPNQPRDEIGQWAETAGAAARVGAGLKTVEHLREVPFAVGIDAIKPSQTKKYTFTKSGASPSTSTAAITLRGDLTILDGNHRYYQALQQGAATVMVKFSRSKEQATDAEITAFIKAH